MKMYDRDLSAGYLTNWAGRLFVRAIERRLAGGNAGPMPVFFALSDGRSLSQSALARWASVEQPTMANTLARMERDGLIARQPDPADRRSARVTLTPVGREQAAAALDSARAVNEIAVAGFTPAERKALLDLLRRVAENLGRDSEESPPPLPTRGKRGGRATS
jgi:DNA-binding MarR family transcriptional regulator